MKDLSSILLIFYIFSKTTLKISNLSITKHYQRTLSYVSAVLIANVMVVH